jgi:hypothetical protein
MHKIEVTERPVVSGYYQGWRGSCAVLKGWQYSAFMTVECFIRTCRVSFLLCC